MIKRRIICGLCVVAVALLLGGCASAPYDYTNYRAHPPRSILVLPPLNNSTEVGATYGYLSTITRPIAEMGYYVFPVAVVDQVLKENGLPTAGEMHTISLKKVHELIGADAVLYATIKQYGSKYQIISSTTVVAAEAELVDVKTGLLLWKGAVNLQISSSSGNIIVDLVASPFEQAVNQSTDQAHKVSAIANAQLFTTKNQGLLPGPYFPQDKKQ
jgi:hypothetical protein